MTGSTSATTPPGMPPAPAPGTPTIPDVAGLSTLDAAFAYGRSGLYIVPVRARTKRPGGYLGDGWPSRSVYKGPDIHDMWAERWPRAGIGIHAGRSGLVIIDVDRPDRLDERIRQAVADTRPPFQVTRRLPGLDAADGLARALDLLDRGQLRGHAVFRTPPGRVLGNSLGQLTKGWGEIRGLNGFIVTAPSLHEEPDGEYRWLRHGDIPLLPGDVADVLPDGAGDAESAASTEQVDAFTRAHGAGTRRDLMDAVVRRFTDLVRREGEGRHQAACTIAAWITREAAAGLYPAGVALQALRQAFTAEVSGDARPKASRVRPGGIDAEWAGIVAWAVGQVLGISADRLDEIRGRVDPSYIPPGPATVGGNGHNGPPGTRTATVEGAPTGSLFDGWTDPTPGGVGSPGTAMVPVYEAGGGEGDGDAEGRFWAARPVLAHIRRSAIAGYASPWATLGVVLARVLAATPPTVQLPNTIGGYGSLNLFVALVAGPSGGKGAADAVARGCVEIDPVRSGSMTAFQQNALGSGEGLAHMFMKRARANAKTNPDPEPYQYNTAALVTIAEIDTLAALQGRQGSTLSGQLRQAAMGEQLGFFYVDKDKRMLVPEHAYRLCLVAGVQPRRAGGLFDEADGGTPQRFVWLPADVPPGTLPDEADMPEVPDPVLWTAPVWPVATVVRGRARVVVPLPAAAVARTVELRRLSVQGLGDPLDGHANYVRLKVAVALAVLDGRCEVGDDDWDLSGVVMGRSTVTRQAILDELAAERRERNRTAAEAEAVKTIIVANRVDQQACAKLAHVVRTRLARDGDGREWVTHGQLNQSAGRARDHLETVLDGLVKTGVVEREDYEYHGQQAVRYRLT